MTNSSRGQSGYLLPERLFIKVGFLRRCDDAESSANSGSVRPYEPAPLTWGNRPDLPGKPFCRTLWSLRLAASQWLNTDIPRRQKGRLANVTKMRCGLRWTRRCAGTRATLERQRRVVLTPRQWPRNRAAETRDELPPPHQRPSGIAVRECDGPNPTWKTQARFERNIFEEKPA